MKAFNDLTERGKLKRLLPLARQALLAWPIDVAVLKPLAIHTNALFRVDAIDGARYALRVCDPGQHDENDYHVELSWMAALARDTNLRIARPMAARDGSYFNEASAAGVPQPRCCMLFGWVPGRAMADSPTPDQWSQLGEALARLHMHAAQFKLEPGLSPMRWDKTFYYVHEPVVVFEPGHADLFSAEQVALIQARAAQVDALLADWWQVRTPHLIHCDLHNDNVHVHRGQLWLLDFEDLLLGFPEQDLAVALYRSRFRDEYHMQNVAALRAGYERISPWPPLFDAHAQTLFDARTLMFVNYCANQRHDQDMLDYLPTLLGRL
jgi:Ser/Thr protein kinase RdoA (MazF antagonist)